MPVSLALLEYVSLLVKNITSCFSIKFMNPQKSVSFRSAKYSKPESLLYFAEQNETKWNEIGLIDMLEYVSLYCFVSFRLAGTSIAKPYCSQWSGRTAIGHKKCNILLRPSKK